MQSFDCYGLLLELALAQDGVLFVDREDAAFENGLDLVEHRSARAKGRRTNNEVHLLNKKIIKVFWLSNDFINWGSPPHILHSFRLSFSFLPTSVALTVALAVALAVAVAVVAVVVGAAVVGVAEAAEEGGAEGA